MAAHDASVEVRHAERDGDLILLAVEGRQRRTIVPHFGPDDRVTLAAMSDLGNAIRSAGDPLASVTLYEELAKRGYK